MKKISKHTQSIFHSIHIPHLKRRLALELIGLLVLIPLIWRERAIVEGAIETLRSSDVIYLTIAIALYWIAIPLSSVSLRILCRKKISLFNATLTRIAGSGPGRIIPGGLGAASLDVLHLKKSHARFVHNHAISIVAVQQIVAIGTNTILVIFILFLHEPLRDYVNSLINQSTNIFIVVLLIFTISLILWFHHLRAVRKRIVPIEKRIKKQLFDLLRFPSKTARVIGVALLITCVQATILLLTSHSLGTSMTIWDAIIALSSGVLIGSIVPTPGGIGVVEAGITASLVALGYDPAHAAGVAILYRVISYWLPLIPGTFSYLYLVDKKII